MRLSSACLAALAAGLLFLPALSRGDDDATPNTKTLARLRQFVAVERAFIDSPLGLEAADRQVWLACDRLSRRLRDNELPEVEAFAVGPEAREVRWLLAGILIQRNRFDAAAHVLVCELSEDPENRKYRVWKWWYYQFRQRADREEMSRKITEGFLHQFEHGTPQERRVIAEIFGKGREEAEMDPGEFRKAIGLSDAK
jgi:hypothetical protein